MCYAVQVAYDSPDDPIYASGWSHGQNGGFGFTPWVFHGTSVTLDPGCTGNGCSEYADPPGSMSWVSTGQQAIDSGLKAGGQGSSEFNDIGKAWVLYNPHAPNDADENPPSGATDIARAGRGFTFGSLQPDHTLSIVIDNPSERRFFRGYTVRLINGGANGCFDGHNCSTWTNPGEITSRLSIGTFEYSTDGKWYATGADPQLIDTDTSSGLRIDVTLTSADTYDLTMTPLANPDMAYMASGELGGTVGSVIDWIEVELYNTDSDFYPAAIETRAETDLYIRSIEVTAPDGPGVAGDYNSNGTVDAADYVLWRNGGPLQNEVQGVTPGNVTPEDYDAWRARFGNTAGAAGGSAVVAAVVPEPSASVFVIAGGALVGAARARFRKRE
jgi:hypothetical protein